MSTDDGEENVFASYSHSEQPNCATCLSCIMSFFWKLKTMSNLFNNLYLILKYILTIPVMQVTCERVFNEQKKLKTHTRNSLY